MADPAELFAPPPCPGTPARLARMFSTTTGSRQVGGEGDAGALAPKLEPGPADACPALARLTRSRSQKWRVLGRRRRGVMPPGAAPRGRRRDPVVALLTVTAGLGGAAGLVAGLAPFAQTPRYMSPDSPWALYRTPAVEEPQSAPGATSSYVEALGRKAVATFGYADCAAARRAGAAPLRRGDPGFRAALDADNDGVACEPFPQAK